MSIHGTRRKAGGFTLIELLVVLMVIAILASLSIARYMNARDKSCVAAAAYDLDLVRKMLAFYEADWNRYPPAAATYQDLQNQLINADGNSYGQLPLANTYQFVSYAIDADGNYIIRVQALDNGGTVLVATPESIQRQ